MPLTSTDKWKEIIADLGRPTLRGIRKCPKCATINGTRGNSCKNKNCDVVFRDIGTKKKAAAAKQQNHLPSIIIGTVSISHAPSIVYETSSSTSPPTVIETIERNLPNLGFEQWLEGVSEDMHPEVISIAHTPSSSSSSISPPTVEKNLPNLGFEQWLAGVNERINLLHFKALPTNNRNHETGLNYQQEGLSETKNKTIWTPEPLVFYVYDEFFDCLKERISNTGSKKRRLPNQTLLVHRDDASPKRSLTKYIWKITSLVQLLNIFSCSLVPLKTTQYFIKTGNSTYEEWVVPPKEVNPSIKTNQPIAPVLHSTQLKIGNCGQSDCNLMQKEYSNSGMQIEWIPEFLPNSRHGELTLQFEFDHSKQAKV